MTKSFIETTLSREDQSFEAPLRPDSLVDFIGQEKIRERLDVFMGAAKLRGEALGHCLFCGPPGLGKTTLSHIIAKSMGTQIIVTSGPVLDKPGDLAGLLTNLQDGDIFFLDEIHRLNRNVEEYLYTAMEDFVLDLMIDSGPSARSVQVNLNRFSLVGATTRAGLLTGPLRSRFAMTCRLDYYEPKTLEKIIARSAGIINFSIDAAACREISERSRGTPRIANHLLRWVRDFTQMRSDKQSADREITCEALNMLAIDSKGLDEMDKKILSVIIDHYNGGPVGVKTIAVAVGEESSTIEEVYEPYLILKGFLQRTAKGRKATALAYQHLEKEMGEKQEELQF